MTASKLVQGILIPNKLLQFNLFLVRSRWTQLRSTSTTFATTSTSQCLLEQQQQLLQQLSAQWHGQQSWRLQHATRTMSNSSTGSTATKVATAAAASLPSSGSTATTTTTSLSTASATKTFTKAPAPVAASSTSRQSGSSTRRTTAKTGGGSANASSYLPLLQAGLPLILFTILGLWVTSHAYGGKLRELEASRGQSSLSLRQAALAQEHDSMMERLNHIAALDFDNTKRILRPEEILEQRRLARQRRNAWHRRWYRWVAGIREEENVE
jgi:hypothetical protein